MRTFFAIVSGCAVMLLAFSAPWSLFVVTQHSYGGESQSSQMLGTLVFFATYLLPFSIVFAFVLVWPVERLVRRVQRTAYRRLLRGAAWLLVAMLTYIGSASAARHDCALAAFVCGAFAAVAAAFVYSVLVGAPRSPLSHDTINHTPAAPPE